jgi:uncharacterized membrane protein YeaQ/YmgE (transglycosylase-associated protein family)
MTAVGFLWFIATIVVIVGAILLLYWALGYMGTPEQPKRILMVVAAVVGAIIIIAYVLRLASSVTLFPP